MPDHNTHGIFTPPTVTDPYTLMRKAVRAMPDPASGPATLRSDLEELRPGDVIIADFASDGAKWTITGTVAQPYEWLIIDGVCTPLWNPITKRASDHLVRIVDKTAAPRPYAEGTDRAVPMLGDVVEGTFISTGTVWRWICAAPDGPNQWLLQSNSIDDGPPWWSTEDLPKSLRLVAELRAVAA